MFLLHTLLSFLVILLCFSSSWAFLPTFDSACSTRLNDNQFILNSASGKESGFDGFIMKKWEIPFENSLRKMTASVALVAAPLLMNNLPANAVEQMSQLGQLPSTSLLMSNNNDGPQGIPAVTQSEIGKSVRSSVVGGAQLVDKIDLKWERFSDSLRDKSKCDPRTNRRMFDNGYRRDGTPIGNPVLGALCTPEPLGDLDTATAKVVLDLGKEAAMSTWKVDLGTLQKKQEQVQQLVGPAFTRAISSLKDNSNGDNSNGGADNSETQVIKRQAFNGDLYTQLRAFGEFNTNRESARSFEIAWGDKLLATLAPNGNRNDYKSPFPKPDDTENQPYDEGALLDALGKVSVAFTKLQEGGVIGHWEISIPEDDDWNVVTIAVDDDISIGGQILARERQQPLGGSEVVALVRAALENQAKISYKMDTFFIDPTTTRQELYDPTQLLISLSDLGQ